MIRVLTTALAVSLLAGPAIADDPLTPAPVEQALARSVVDGVRDDWRFTITISSADGDVVGRFDGDAAPAEQWRLVSPTDVELSDGQSELWADIIDPSEDDDEGDGLFFSVEDIEMQPGSFDLLSEQTGEAIYGFTPELTGDTDEDAAFAENLQGELSIAVDTPHVRQVRIFAPRSFKPHMAVRINAFEIVQEYEIMDGLPAPVLRRFAQTIEGSAAFQQFQENVEFRFSEIEYLGR
jgi:hypothetical protein